MRVQVDAMRRIGLFVGFFVVIFQASPAPSLTLESLDQKSLEKLDSIDINHPDFKLKIASCNLFDGGSARILKELTGEQAESVTFEDDYHEKFYRKMVDFLGISFDKHFKKGSQAYSLGLKLIATIAHENLGYEAVRQVCSSAFENGKKHG